MADRYWPRVHRRALSDTRHALAIETRERVLIAAALFIIALCAIWLFGGHELARDELYIRIALTGAIFLLRAPS